MAKMTNADRAVIVAGHVQNYPPGAGPVYARLGKPMAFRLLKQWFRAEINKKDCIWCDTT